MRKLKPFHEEVNKTSSSVMKLFSSSVPVPNKPIIYV